VLTTNSWTSGVIKHDKTSLELPRKSFVNPTERYTIRHLGLAGAVSTPILLLAALLSYALGEPFAVVVATASSVLLVIARRLATR
jgi:hypothetical protein